MRVRTYCSVVQRVEHLKSLRPCVCGRVSAKVDLAIPKGAAAARQGKSKYRHAVRQTAEQREEKDEVEEELKRRGTRMTT